MPEFAALKPGVNGLTFRRNDVCDLAHTLAKLMGDESQLTAMSAAAIATTEADFNTDSMARRFLDAMAAVQRKGLDGAGPGRLF